MPHTRAVTCASAALFLMLLVVGCETGHIEVALRIVDEFDVQGRTVERTVRLGLPLSDAAEQVAANVVAQARKEGWQASCTRLSAEESLVIAATREFRADDNRHYQTFTKLFGPYYLVSHDGTTHSVTGRLYGQGIQAALQAEAVRFAVNRGYGPEYVSVAFKYPVKWDVLCKGVDTQASAGAVAADGRVRLSMYQTQFLGQAPLTVQWREPGYGWPMVLVAVAAIAGAAAGLRWYSRAYGGRGGAGTCTVNARCRARLADGTQCGRQAVRGSDFCAQHDEYGFSERDEFEPRYCHDCGRQTPRSVLDRQTGLCDECLVRGRRREQAIAAAEAARREAAEQAEEARRRAVYETDTGRGTCPACGSRNVEHFTTGGADTSAQSAFACCSCLFIAWPLAFLAPFLFRHPEQHHARCRSCGHRWAI